MVAQEVLRCVVPLANSPVTPIVINVLAGCVEESCPLHKSYRGRFTLQILHPEEQEAPFKEKKELEPK